MPLASESTEADENSPDLHRNSMSPRNFLPLKASMSLPLKGRPPETHFSSGKYQEENWSGCKGVHLGSCHMRSNGFETHASSPQRACGSVGCSAELRTSDQRLLSQVSSKDVPDSVSKISTPQIFSAVSDESGSDDGVAVYIDETEDDGASDGLLITECRISSRRAAEIRAFKAQWVQQMLLKKEKLLTPCLDKVARGDRRRTSSISKEVNGHEAGAAALSGGGDEFLESKLRAFAACMVPEALEYISRNGKRWAESTSDTSDSDIGESPLASSHCSRRWHSTTSLGESPPPGSSLHTSATSDAPNLATNGVQRRGEHTKEHEQRAVDAALHSWGRFLKYIRRTSRVLPSRQRIERMAGLESDDDDEQAPLYMCRPGSVQRPSPLISYSLTEHLKASGTMFFKQFRRQCLHASAPPKPDASGTVTSRQQERPSAPHESSFSPTLPAVQESPTSKSVGTAVEDDGEDPHAEKDTEETVPLYEISAETSALFGDMMRLEDTARMLDASCTFRLPAAPSSIVCRACVRATHRRSGLSAFSSGTGLCSAASSDSPSATTTAGGACTQHRRTGHVTLYTSPHAATAAALSKLIANCQADKSLRAHARQNVPCSASAGAGDMKPGESCYGTRAQVGSDPCVVYTVQADEDTLALSGLDAEYCARVEWASRWQTRAAWSLANLDCMQLNGNALQASETSAPAHKKKRKAPISNNVATSDEEDSTGERSPLEEETPEPSCRAEAADEANRQRSLMVDKLVLAHLMPYLPQFSPP